METYRKKVRAFLYEPENFEVLWELYDFIPTSRKDLFFNIVSEFLTEVEKGLRIAVADTDWRVKLHVEDNRDYPDVCLFKDEWQGFFDVRLEFGVGAFDAWYGLWRDIKEYPYLLNDDVIEQLVDTFAGVKHGFEPREDWWLTWKYIGHFADVEDLKKLLPSTRSALVTEYADTLVSFAEEIAPHMPELVDSVEPVTAFREIVDIYNKSAEPGFRTGGSGTTYRQITCHGWPPQVHYECRDEGIDGFGFDIHLEADHVKYLAEVLAGFKEPLAALFPDAEVLWDPVWSKNRGRLRVLFERGPDAGTLAEEMKVIIKETFPVIDKALKKR